MKCLICGLKEATQRHEIWFGHGTRETSIEYNLFAFLCPACHLYEVHVEKRKYQLLICDKIGLNFFEINFIMNKNTKDWTAEDINVMEKTAKYMEKYLDK